MKFEKILQHPDRNWILEMLTDDMGLRAIQNKIKEKYKDDATKHVSETLLRKFTTEGLGVIRHESTKEEIEMAFNSYIDNKQIPETAYRNYTAPAKYEVHDHSELAEAIREELPAFEAIIEDTFRTSLIATKTVLEQALAYERDMKDYMNIVSATEKMSNMYHLYCNQHKAAMVEESYDSYMTLIEDDADE